MKSAALVSFAFFTLFLQASAPVNHKFFLSNTTFFFNAQNHAIEITSKIFTDDLEKVIEATCYRYTPLLPQTADSFDKVKNYIGEKISLSVAEKNLVLNFIGYSVENDMTTLFLEAMYVEPTQVKITNTLLLEAFPDQQNIVEVRWNGQSKREYFTKEKTFFQFIP